jgi:ribosomal protein S18 acetylase RimI-like enzyme
MTSSIRRAEANDLDRLVELHRRFCEVDHHPFDEGRARAAFAGLLDDDTNGMVWLVDVPGGYAVLTWGWSIEAGGAEAVLDEIFVTDRGAGVGSLLIEHVLAEGRRRGLARIVLETEATNTAVRSLYERHGFVSDDSIWMSHQFVELS